MVNSLGLVTAATPERPKFGKKQILSPDQIEIGKRYAVVHSHLGEDQNEVHIVRSVNIKKKLVHTTKIYSDGERVREEFHLTDADVLPYENGLWNPTNYLILME